MRGIIAVVTPVSTTRLVTLASVKENLGLSGSTYDTLLTRFIDEATFRLARRSDRPHWGSERVTETWRFDDCQEHILLSRRPPSQIHTITVDGTALTTADWERDGRKLYRLDGSDGRREWSSGKTVVDYTAGYVLEASAPADLAAACRTLVALQWFARARDPLVKSEDVPGVISQEYWVGDMPVDDPDGLPAGIASMCWYYRSI